MLWIKIIKFALIVAIFLVLLLLGVEFATLHTQQVDVNYLLGTTTLELAWVVVGAFASGVLLTALIGAFVVLPLRWRVARLRQAVAGKDQEISLLARKAGRDGH
ncbi:MAG: LapA family protein [Candidatus Contendobacter sp.]